MQSNSILLNFLTATWVLNIFKCWQIYLCDVSHTKYFWNIFFRKRFLYVRHYINDLNMWFCLFTAWKNKILKKEKQRKNEKNTNQKTPFYKGNCWINSHSFLIQIVHKANRNYDVFVGFSIERKVKNIGSLYI